MNLLKLALQALPQAAASPLAFIAYLAGVASWVWVAHRTKRLGLLLGHLKDLPKARWVEIIQTEIGSRPPRTSTPSNGCGRGGSSITSSASSRCALALCLVGIATWAATQKDQKVNELQNNVTAKEAELVHLQGEIDAGEASLQAAREQRSSSSPSPPPHPARRG